MTSLLGTVAVDLVSSSWRGRLLRLTLQVAHCVYLGRRLWIRRTGYRPLGLYVTGVVLLSLTEQTVVKYVAYLMMIASAW